MGMQVIICVEASKESKSDTIYIRNTIRQFYKKGQADVRFTYVCMCKMVPYEENGYVAEIKLPHIKNIAEQAKKTKHIKKIMLFGSSLEERCTEDSDIDIAVFGDKTKGSYIDSKEFRGFKSGLFKFDIDQAYDVLYFKEKQIIRMKS